MAPESLFNFMLMLTFINGAFVCSLVYYFIQIHRVQQAYESMLSTQSTLQNMHSIENESLREKISTNEQLLFDIQSQMEKDTYSDLSEINKQIKQLETVTQNHSKSFQIAQNFEKQTIQSLSQLNQKLKNLGDDPMLIRGY